MKVLGFTAISFDWIHKYPLHCDTFLSPNYVETADVDDLITITRAIDKTGPDVTVTTSFVIDDYNDAKKARTQDF